MFFLLQVRSTWPPSPVLFSRLRVRQRHRRLASVCTLNCSLAQVPSTRTQTYTRTRTHTHTHTHSQAHAHTQHTQSSTAWIFTNSQHTRTSLCPYFVSCVCAGCVFVCVCVCVH